MKLEIGEYYGGPLDGEPATLHPLEPDEQYSEEVCIQRPIEPMLPFVRPWERHLYEQKGKRMVYKGKAA